ncbi:cupin domain-containing protein [Propionivibrio sp.]|uniref:cupin domain-containing protein n=1 Tax=Propionivibrio sp. TaxID=2212460 RepID=UPI0025ED3ACC|nr:cupin domain-containing protein [Propionivibrio sp.]MBK7355851.1 cupin domain-containing protein [Propionivibrio sp.]MBK8400484.1 cupin domain-containing protein [Propionivibrio sp.]MBK8745970.1 cupin domain-containing protein [Propionivibrio sp.]MBK8895251.1 cupin domain-containing protein [Propionivibrio sp.]MBL0206842.1 cupin domain-containing protein [Propionivibrio sp.]
MTKPIINIADVELEPRPGAFTPTGSAAERFDAKMAYIGPRIGAQKLGYNITAVPPGKRAFPLHNHRVNEEMFFVLQGTGEVSIGDSTYPIRSGDVIACPAGGKETAHQIVNTGADELRYLAVSTKLSPEIAEYPNSGKFGVLAELPAGPDGKPQRFMFVGRECGSLNYWEGE